MLPTSVHGCDKTISDYFNLTIKEEETSVVHRIYQWYLQEGYGASKIAVFSTSVALQPNETADGVRMRFAIFSPMSFTGEQLEVIQTQTFREIEDIADVRQMTNAQLKRIIQKIEVDKNGNVDIYLRLFGDWTWIKPF